MFISDILLSQKKLETKIYQSAIDLNQKHDNLELKIVKQLKNNFVNYQGILKLLKLIIIIIKNIYF